MAKIFLYNARTMKLILQSCFNAFPEISRMKLLVNFVLFIVINACLASPVDYRWNLIPDGDGNMHVIDLNRVEAEPEAFFNPEVDTAFLLFTRFNPTVPQRITWTSDSIAGSNYNPLHPVRFLIHGFNSGPSSGVNIAPTASYLRRGDFNVIVVDWSIGANTINYISARNRVPLVGNVLARLIDFLVTSNLTQMNRVFIAGHSLGAHIAGIAGKRVTSGRVQTIFGLDPGGPLFSLNSPNDRFDAGDAVYTEGIRTNAGGNFGFAEPLGQADFYPNWGMSQPGCGIDLTQSCAHSRAHELFAESIISDRFVGRSCQSYQEILSRSCTGTGTAVMGGDVRDVRRTGIFFLETNGNMPFALG